MSHTISKPDYMTTTPTGLYEANYRRLSRLVPDLTDFQVNECISLPESKLLISILEQHKYTTVISLKLSLGITNLAITPEIVLSAIDMDLRICHDACVVEVIGYQGKSPVQSALSYPNKHMLQIDEKKQLNLLLKDILESSLKNEYHPGRFISSLS